MVRSTCSRIGILVLVPLLLHLLRAAGGFTGVHPNTTDGSGPSSPWLNRVRRQRVSGCADRPWVCNQGAEGGWSPPWVRRRCCGNRCVEVTSDVNNCGVCGIRCPYTWQCCRGLCTDTNINPFNCGRCGNRCPFLTFCTYGMCGYSGAPPYPFPPRPPKPPRPPFPFPPKPPKPFPPKPPKPFPPKPPKPELPQPPEYGGPPPADALPPAEYGQPPPEDGG